MKIGMFGYPGDYAARTRAICDALRDRGAEKIVCLGGLAWSGKKEDEETAPPATVLRWLRSNDIPTLANDMDRQVAGWRLQALDNTTGYIKPQIRKLLGAITREEAQWIYSRPGALPFGKALCCADNLTIDALFPVPLSQYNASRLFTVMEQKAAFFPSSNGPGLLVRKQDDNVIEAGKFEYIEEQLDCPKAAALIGGVVGSAPLNADVIWGAIVDSEATRVSLVCLDAKTLKKVPEHGTLLLQRANVSWRA